MNREVDDFGNEVTLDIVHAEAKGKEMKADGSVCRKV